MLACAAAPMRNDDGNTGSLPDEIEMLERARIRAGEPPQVSDDVGGRDRAAHSIPNRCGSQSEIAGM